MSKEQRHLIFITLVLSSLMVLFPPYYIELFSFYDHGYSFILDPPLHSSAGEIYAKINVLRLLIQLAVLWAISGLFFLGLKRKLNT